MALDGTYAGLLASIADWLNRKDLTATIPDFVTLCEAQMSRRLRVRRMVGGATVSISSEYTDLPTDFAGSLALTMPDGRQLDQLSPDGLAQKKWLTNPGDGEPRWFAIIGTQVQVLPAPDEAYDALLTYFQMLPGLATAGSNWLLPYAPDAYLYGSLTQAAPYLKDDSRIPVWGTLFTTALQDIKTADAESYGTRLTSVGGPTP